MNTCCRRCYDKFNVSPTYYKSKSAASENGQSFQVSNNNGDICRIKTDKGIIPIEKGLERCDYLFVLCQKKDSYYYFVELKGGGDKGAKGYDQIVSTIEYLTSHHKIDFPKNRVMGFIIGGVVTSEMNRMKESFRQKYGISLIHKAGKNQSYTHSA